jgi:FkbM family methyltransferase
MRRRDPVHRALASVTPALLGLVDWTWQTELYEAQQMARRIAERAASGSARARVVLAGMLFGTRRWRRPITLKLDTPHGKLPFVIPDYAAFRVLGQMFYDQDYDVDLPEPVTSVVDLGGHVGISCLFFRRKWPSSRILAVEPSPTLFPLLARNVARLGVEVRHAALADRPGKVQFVESALSWGGRTRPAAGGAGDVDAITLDSLLEHPVDLLKLDVEGAELSAVPAATRLHNARAIVGEIHAPIRAHETRVVVGALESAGFSVSCRDVARFTLFKAMREQQAPSA